MVRSLPVGLVIAAIAVGVGALAGGPVLGGVPALAWLAAVAVGVQWVAFVPAWLGRTERFYDLTGTLTYLTVIALALAIAHGTVGVRGLVVGGMVVVWAVRLGTFLVRRIRRTGKDGRFDAIKADTGRFFLAWTLQGLWVFLTSLAALTIITDADPPPLGALDALGGAVWAMGMALEVVADRQKARFAADPAHEGQWIDSGLWSISRHPNYLGEIVLWTGVAIVGVGVFEGSQTVALISPLFVTLLLTRISGIPLLEQRADARWGDDPAYAAYKARTPVLMPWVGRG